MEPAKQYTSVPFLAGFVTLLHLVLHLKFEKCYTFYPCIYWAKSTFSGFCNTVTLELKLSLKIFCYRLRRLLATSNRIYALHENFLKMPVQVLQCYKTDFSFESEEATNGVMG